VLRTPSIRSGLLLLALFVFAPPAAAQAQTAPDQSGFSTFPSTRPPGPWMMDGTLWLDYLMTTRDFPGSKHVFAGTASAQLGIFSRGALAVRVPVIFLERFSDGQSTGAGVGNISLDGRVRLLGAAADPNGAVKDGSALALRGMVFFPLGGPYGYGSTLSRFSAISDIEVFGIVAGAEFAWTHRYDESSRYRDELALQLGFRLPLRLLSRTWPGRVQEAALLELNVSSWTKDFFDKASTPVNGRLGYRFGVDDIYGTLMVGTELTHTADPDLRVTFGIGYAPRKHDQDADGVPDSRDQCVHLPEDRDGFQDDDGCADDDNDGDMIVDEDDRCPLAPAEEGRDQDEDGCTDT
jgi:hypothetical protein